jgi:hypothetical protein
MDGGYGLRHVIERAVRSPPSADACSTRRPEK